MRAWAAGFLVSFMFLVSPAAANCADQPPVVKAYLRAHPEWRMRVLEGLAGDQKEWHELKGDACPGMAALDLDGRGRVYALLLDQRSDPRHGRAVIVGRKGWENLLGDADEPALEVLFRIPPGKYQDQYDFHKVTLQHDGVVIGNWCAGAVGYYLSGGRLKKFQSSE